MHISAAADAAELPVKTVRYYADIGLVPAPDRTEAGYRAYTEDAVRKLIFVRRARAFGFSIEECRELLALYTDRQRSSADVKRIASAHLDRLDAQARDLDRLRSELSHLVQSCRGDSRPDCPIIDHLG